MSVAPDPYIIAQELPTVLSGQTALIVLGAILLIGLAVGFRDLLRFSLGRVRAIASVVYVQAIRRRVLWMTPAVILAVVVISQLAQPVDAQDNIRQTSKFLLFATAMLVVLVTILIAATNLPKEIENRVIYTVATKPATRFEIVLGKVLGFAGVSGMMLVLMGVLGYGYLQIKEWRLRKGVEQQLAMPGLDRVRRQTLEYYRISGLLHARTFVTARGKSDPTDGFEVYADAARGAEGWTNGGAEQSILVPFDNFMDKLTPELLARGGKSGFLIAVTMDVRRDRQRADGSRPTTSTSQPSEPAEAPHIGLNLKNAAQATVLDGSRFLRPAIPRPEGLIMGEKYPDRGFPVTPGQPTLMLVDAQALGHIEAAGPRFYLEIIGLNAEWQVRLRSAQVQLPQGSDGKAHAINPSGPVIHRSRFGTHGYQIRGQKDGQGPVAVWSFRDTSVSPRKDGTVPFELKVGIERAGDENDDATVVELNVINKAGGASHKAQVEVESKRPVYFSVPAAAVAGGNFDVEMQCLTTAHWIGMRTGPEGALRLIAANHPFALNLAASLFVMWLLSILVGIICLFCSTFVSWPIAIVLGVLMLLGHWAVTQLDVRSGMERQIFQDVFGRSASAAQTTAGTEVIKGMTQGLQAFASILPDVSQFGAIEPVERGATVPLRTLLESLKVCFLFGVPLVILTYVFLRFKEVAP